MDIEKSQRKVAGFHRKYGFPMNISITDTDPDNDESVRSWGETLLRMSVRLKKTAMEMMEAGDPRLYRFYHTLEELGEFGIALANRDEIELADALGDLQYLLLGDAVTFDIPMGEVFDEIHRSNMTKTRKIGDERMKDRSAESGFLPPDLKTAIEKGRAR